MTQTSRVRFVPPALLLCFAGLTIASGAAKPAAAEPAKKPAAVALEQDDPKVVARGASDLARLEALVEQYQPAGVGKTPGNNAWAAYITAIQTRRNTEEAAWKKATDGTQNINYDPTVLYYTAPPDDAEQFAREVELARKMLREFERAGLFKQLDTMAAAPRAVRAAPDTKACADAMRAIGTTPEPWDGRLATILLPDLGEARKIARINTGRMRLAAQAGDVAAFGNAVEQNLALARICAHQWTIIDRLVSIAITSLTLQHARFAMQEGLNSAEAVTAVQSAIDRQLLIPPLALPIGGEQIAVENALSWLMSADGSIDPKRIAEAQALLVGSGTPGFDPSKLAPGLATLADSKAKADEYFAGIRQIAQLPRYQRITAKFNGTRFIEDLPAKFIALRIVLPDLSKSFASADQCELQVLGLRTMLALERFKLAAGAYPASLQDLVGKQITAVPVDPYAGQPLRYKLLPAGSDPAGRGYLLYSVGTDGQDDGGKQPANVGERYSVISAKGLPGFDYVLNATRAED